MWAVIKTILTSPFGSFAFVFALLCTAFWLVHYITKFIERLNSKTERVEKLENNIDSIKGDLHYIKATLNVIQANYSNLTQSHSPVSLTPKGKEVAQKMGIDEMIAENWDKIYDVIEKRSFNNAYDIQQFCIETATVNLDEFFSPSDVNKIKTFAYNEGHQIAYYGSMIGVILRDKYFESKGISVSEVDDNDPQKQ